MGTIHCLAAITWILIIGLSVEGSPAIKTCRGRLKPPGKYDIKFRRVEISTSFKMKNGSILENVDIDLDLEESVRCIYPLENLFSYIENSGGDIWNNIIIFDLRVYCPRKDMVVQFSRLSSTNFTSTFISYLEVTNCRMSLESIGVYGEATDLRVLTLFDWDEGQEDLNQTINFVEGIHRVNSLTVIYSEMSPINWKIFQMEWPFMAELNIGHGNLSNYLKSAPFTMPHLQTLALQACVLDEIPPFPWNNYTRNLPRNLERTEFFQELYAVDIAPDIFLRGLLLYGMPILGQEGFFKRYQVNNWLHTFHLSLDSIQGLGMSLLTQQRHLLELVLSHNLLSSLPEGIFDDLSSLTSLDLSHNNLSSIHPRIFSQLETLEILNLKNNYLIRLESFDLFPMQNLRSLDVSNNEIEYICNTDSDFRLPKLTSIQLENNRLRYIPRWVYFARSLTNINMNGNKITFETFIQDIKNLNQGELIKQNQETSNNQISPFQSAESKTISLWKNNFTSFSFTEFCADNKACTTFKIILAFFNIDLEYNELNCDCSMYSISNYLRNPAIKNSQLLPSAPEFYKENWKCTYPEHIRSIPLAKVNCRNFVCPLMEEVDKCPSPCDCSKRAFDDTILINCTGRNLTRLPGSWPNNTDTLLFGRNNLTVLSLNYLTTCDTLSVLDLSDNNIESFKLDEESLKFLDTLSVLKLHRNKIRMLPKQFQQFEYVNMTLEGNKLQCDCKTRWMVSWLQNNHERIEDIEKVFCFPPITDEEFPLYKLDEANFTCEILTREEQGIIATCLAIVLLLIGLSVLYKYRGELRLLLYMHCKCRLFDKPDDCDIVGKVYDAFVTYSSEDRDWVMDVLVPRLETEERSYRLCVADRNFHGGDDIIDNIGSAIKESRRMIMLLTNNFLSSSWCRFEFRNAHDRVIKSRTNYLIILLADDVNVEGLDESMKLYLRTKTYISVSSQWFWPSLYFAMPRVPLTEFSITNTPFSTNRSCCVESSARDCTQVPLHAESLSRTNISGATVLLETSQRPVNEGSTRPVGDDSVHHVYSNPVMVFSSSLDAIHMSNYKTNLSNIVSSSPNPWRDLQPSGKIETVSVVRL